MESLSNLIYKFNVITQKGKDKEGDYYEYFIQIENKGWFFVNFQENVMKGYVVTSMDQKKYIKLNNVIGKTLGWNIHVNCIGKQTTCIQCPKYNQLDRSHSEGYHSWRSINQY